jgi:hypothetical protein
MEAAENLAETLQTKKRRRPCLVWKTEEKAEEKNK